MTVAEFYQFVYTKPLYIVIYFLLPIVTVFFATQFKNIRTSYLCSISLYLISIPALFNTFLSAYRIMFEGRSVMELNLVVDVLPLVSLVVISVLIRRKYTLKELPGFGKLYGLFLMLLSLFVIMFIIEKTRIIIFSMMPFSYFVGIFVILLVALRVGWKKLRLP